MGRQLAAVVLIFALLLQGTASAVAAARLAANATGDPDWAGYELCRHNGVNNDGGNNEGGSAAQPGSAPASPDRHCVFCLAGAT